MPETDGAPMKALTLHQPWASLVALGVKTVETRSWSTSYRGPLAIHAGARQVHSGHFLLLARDARKAGMIGADTEQQFRALNVPFGAIVATCTLEDVLQVTERTSGIRRGTGPSLLSNGHQVPDGWQPYGDYSPGRYAWLLADITMVDPPVPAKGRQGLWTWP